MTSYQSDKQAFWQVILGGIITIGGVFFAVSFAFGIETVKAENGSDMLRFHALFWYYLIAGLIMIGMGILGASVRFLGWPWTPRR